MEDLFIKWRDILKEEQKKRRYVHFDRSIDLRNGADFAKVIRTIKSLKTHQFLPLIKFTKKEIRYKRVNGKACRVLKERPIMYASHLDAHIYSFYNYIWSQKYEAYIAKNDLNDAVLAYRKVNTDTDNESAKSNNNIQFAKEVFEHIQQTENAVVIIADISHFFDSLNHFYLKDRMCEIFEEHILNPEEYKVFRSLTSFRFIISNESNPDYIKFLSDKKSLLKKGDRTTPSVVFDVGRKLIRANRSTVGIPQGSPVSGLLANIYLSSFDKKISESRNDILFRRYSDDIVIVCNSKNYNEVFDNLKKYIKDCHLDINDSKVSLSKFSRSPSGQVVIDEIRDGRGSLIDKKYIDYLGFEFDGTNIFFRGKTLQRARRKGSKKIESHFRRQLPGFKHKKGRSVSVKNRRSGSYLDLAQKIMSSSSSRLTIQKNKLNTALRKKLRISKESLREKLKQ